MNARNAILCFMDTSWELEHAHRIGREVQRLRKLAKLTAQQLGDRTDGLGLKMTRQAISDLENGRRRYVTTAELIILSAALNTSPVNLVFPGPYDGRVELLPGRREEYEFRAVQWFSGIEWHGLVSVDGDDNAADQWNETTENLRMWRQLADLELERMKTQFRMVKDADRGRDDPAIRAVLEAYKGALAANNVAIEQLRRQLGIEDSDA